MVSALNAERNGVVSDQDRINALQAWLEALTYWVEMPDKAWCDAWHEVERCQKAAKELSPTETPANVDK